MSRIPLALSRRGERVEATHFGSVAVVDAAGRLLYGFGDVTLRTYIRSSNKMIQALPVIRSGAAERFGFSTEEIAICCASHSGASYHLDAVRSMLEKMGLQAEALRCGSHEPGDRAELARLVGSGLAPSALHNNCSGKHAGMLATCLAMGWPIDSYLALEHPLQQWVLELMAEFSMVPSEQIGTAIDGCSLPTFYLPLASIATSLARYVEAARGGDPAAARIMEAVAAFPEMIYERGGFDTELVRALGVRCIAKRGAMAVFVIGLDTLQHGPIGITVKLEDGNIAQMPPVVMRVLEQIGVLSPAELELLAPFRRIIVENCNGMRVGDVVSDFMLESFSEALV
jgi:L-asparaginase II